MTTLNISLPEAMRAFIEQKVAQGSYGSASEYIRQLVSQGPAARQAKERLELLLMEGLESGPAVPVTDEFWAEKKAELLKRIEERGT